MLIDTILKCHDVCFSLDENCFRIKNFSPIYFKDVKRVSIGQLLYSYEYGNLIIEGEDWSIHFKFDYQEVCLIACKILNDVLNYERSNNKK